MSARTETERIYLEATGSPATPPRWHDETTAQEARGLSQSCAFVAVRAERAGDDDRARRWWIGARLWGHRADYLSRQVADLGWLTGPHRRAELAKRSRSSAVQSYWQAQRLEAETRRGQ